MKTGTKVNKWTIIGLSEKVYRNKNLLLCQCECGKILSKRTDCVFSIECKSCATKTRDFARFGRIKKVDLNGHVFGSWTVLNQVKSEKRGTFWLCRCSCGKTKEIDTLDLRRSKTTECRSCCSKKHSVRHGYGTRGKIKPEYNSYNQMKSRCLNKNDKRYARYGGRGIKVCQRWLDSFENFISDVGDKPSISHSIDRINNDGDYEPNNVKWSTPKEQANNRSR